MGCECDVNAQSDSVHGTADTGPVQLQQCGGGERTALHVRPGPCDRTVVHVPQVSARIAVQCAMSSSTAAHATCAVCAQQYVQHTHDACVGLAAVTVQCVGVLRVYSAVLKRTACTVSQAVLHPAVHGLRWAPLPLRLIRRLRLQVHSSLCFPHELSLEAKHSHGAPAHMLS